MVERYTLTSLAGMIEAFGDPPSGVRPRFNIAPLQRAVIRTVHGVIEARWGLLPPWRGHGGKRDPHILHAPIESIAQVPVLRNAFRRQRCLVIADGVFAWRRTGRSSQPFWLHPLPDPARPGARSRLVAFAGLAATHRDDDEPSFAIVVGPASPPVAAVSATMPVVIPPDGHASWLTGSGDAARQLLATPPEAWRADPVSTWVNTVAHDDPRCIEPLGNPAQGELF